MREAACQLRQRRAESALYVQTADFGPRTALRIVDTIREDIRAGRVKTRADVRSAPDASHFAHAPYGKAPSPSAHMRSSNTPAAVGPWCARPFGRAAQRLQRKQLLNDACMHAWCVPPGSG